MGTVSTKPNAIPVYPQWWGKLPDVRTSAAHDKAQMEPICGRENEGERMSSHEVQTQPPHEGNRPDKDNTLPLWWREMQSDKLRTYLECEWCEIPILRALGKKKGGQYPQGVPRTRAKQSYDLLAKKVARMSAEEAAVLMRLAPERYLTRASAGKKDSFKALLQQVRLRGMD